MTSADNSENRVKLTTYLKALTDRKETVISLDNEILALLGDDEIENEILSSGDYLIGVEEAIFRITDALETNSVEEKPMPALEDGDKEYIDSKLPKLQLKSFSGSILQFQEFWESFESAVNANKNLKKIAKYNHLRSLLEGQAAATISGLSLTADNYDEAVSLLKSRYGNKQVLISAHIDKLLNLSTVSSGNDTKKLRDLHDEIEISVPALRNLDITSSHYGPMIITIVMSKLPDEIKLIVSRSMAITSTEKSDSG